MARLYPSGIVFVFLFALVATCWGCKRGANLQIASFANQNTNSGSYISKSGAISWADIPEDRRYQVSPNIDKIAYQCLGCHGKIGSSLDAPLIQGQNKMFLIKQLKALRETAKFVEKGKKPTSTNHLYVPTLMGGVMTSQASRLQEGDIYILAEYFSQLDPCEVGIPVNNMGGDAQRGEKLAKRCIGCHSKSPAPSIPKLFGQKTAFIRSSIQAFHQNKRKNAMMTANVKFLMQEPHRIGDVAAYFNQTRFCPKVKTDQ